METIEYPGKMHYQNADVAQRYHIRRTTGAKGTATHYLETSVIKKALDYVLANTRVNSVLDTPCGEGRLIDLQNLYQLNMSYADISDEMMRIAKEKAPDRQFYKMDLEKVDLDREYDLVMCIRLLHHLPDEVKSRVLGSLFKLTKGYVILTFSSPSSLHKRRNQRYTISRIGFEQLATRAGFQVVKQFTIIPLLTETNVAVLRKISR